MAESLVRGGSRARRSAPRPPCVRTLPIGIRSRSPHHWLQTDGSLRSYYTQRPPPLWWLGNRPASEYLSALEISDRPDNSRMTELCLWMLGTVLAIFGLRPMIPPRVITLEVPRIVVRAAAVWRWLLYLLNQGAPLRPRCTKLFVWSYLIVRASRMFQNLCGLVGILS